jgi:hypothetical protein
MAKKQEVSAEMFAQVVSALQSVASQVGALSAQVNGKVPASVQVPAPMRPAILAPQTVAPTFGQMVQAPAYTMPAPPAAQPKAPTPREFVRGGRRYVNGQPAYTRQSGITHKVYGARYTKDMKDGSFWLGIGKMYVIKDGDHQGEIGCDHGLIPIDVSDDIYALLPQVPKHPEMK